MAKTETEKSSIAGLPVELSEAGIVFPKKLSFAEWDEVGAKLAKIHSVTPWLIGDWYNYGESEFGEMAAQADAISDVLTNAGWRMKPGTVQDYAYMAKNFDVPKRFANLTFGHHMVVRSLTHQKRKPLLTYAEKNDLSVADFKKYVDEKTGNASGDGEGTGGEGAGGGGGERLRRAIETMRDDCGRALDLCDEIDGDTSALERVLQDVMATGQKALE